MYIAPRPPTLDRLPQAQTSAQVFVIKWARRAAVTSHVCIYIYICICMYVYIYIYIYIYIYTRICIIWEYISVEIFLGFNCLIKLGYSHTFHLRARALRCRLRVLRREPPTSCLGVSASPTLGLSASPPLRVSASRPLRVSASPSLS